MRRRLAAGLAVVVLFAALTAVMTLPQVRHLGSHVYDSDDPLLSIWRISWIAHALPHAPFDLLNGNIFYPEKRTLAYTDAVLLQGLAGAPLIWAGVSPVVVYNLLLLASIALSGAAMCLYAFRLTGSLHAAVLAGIVFAFVPFRYDHFHHLELQATMFLPLTLWWWDRALASGARRDVWGVAAMLVAQVYCGIYYAVFLVTALAIMAPLQLAAVAPARRHSLLRFAMPALAVAAVVVLPYLAMYVMNRESLGERTIGDVHLYSATLQNYVATPIGNLIYGHVTSDLGQNERRLFPGAIALLLAAVGLIGLDRRRTALLALAATGFIISLGLNTPFYEVIRTVVFTYRGLRAPARAAILVYLGLAALVAFGWARLQPRLKRWTTVATVAVGGAMCLEYATVLDRWLVLPPQPPAVYQWLAAQPRSVVVEFPIPRADRLYEIHEGLYMYRSIEHWQPILNGYSGYFPKSFMDLTEIAKGFPDERAIAYLKTRGVDVIVVHGNLMTPDQFGRITSGLVNRQDVHQVAQFPEKFGPDSRVPSRALSPRGGPRSVRVPRAAPGVPSPDTPPVPVGNIGGLTLVVS